MKYEEVNLVGKQIVKYAKTAKNKVEFTTNDGVYELEFDGDCCSDAYIYGKTEHGSITGKVVTEITEGCDKFLEEGEFGEIGTLLKRMFGIGNLQGSLSIWGVKVVCGDDYLVINHCNDSNGYYDSNVFWTKKS